MKNYIFALILFTFSFTISIVFVNYTIDPYAVHNSFRIKGLNYYKSSISNKVRLTKRHQYKHRFYDGVIVGNSRVDMGLNPNSASLMQLGKFYNLGVPGLNISGQIYYLERFLETHSPHTIFFSVDYADFVSERPIVNIEQPSYPSETSDLLSSLLSLSALEDSLYTVLFQNQLSADRYNNGFNPAKLYLPIIMYENQVSLIKQKLIQIKLQFTGKKWFSHYPTALEFLSNKITNLQNTGVKVIVFINPLHIEYYNQLEEMGLKSNYDEWVTSVHDKLQHSSLLCDFTELGINKSSQRLNDKELMYFWEPAHYKKELGEIMLEKMLKKEC